LTEALLVLLAVLLIAACGLFVAAEFALVTVDRPTVERAAASGDRAARGVLAALRTLSTQLSGAQLGITLTNLGIGYLAEPAIAGLIKGPLRSLGAGPGLASGLAVALALLLATASAMIFGELVPKNLALARPLGTAQATQRFQRGFTRATGPVIRLLNGSANLLLHRFGITPREELASARSAQELFSLVGRSAEHGTLPRETATLVQRSLLFGDRTAQDVMTPRVRMRSVDAVASVAEVIALTRRTGHSRFPVLGEDSDDIVGLVHIKHAVAVPEDERDTTTVRSVMAPVAIVPSGMPLEPLLETLRAGGLQMAIVVDEFGGTDGLVTAEDLIEEIVGDVVDEHDRVSPRAVRHRDGSWLLSGLLRPEEAAEITNMAVPTDDAYQTLGGLMSQALGRIPAAGDTAEIDGTLYTVERMDGRRVDRIRFEPLATVDARVAGRTGSTAPTAVVDGRHTDRHDVRYDVRYENKNDAGADDGDGDGSGGGGGGGGGRGGRAGGAAIGAGRPRAGDPEPRGGGETRS
jgi:CBS domain containing-hemolysin-like protein